MDKKYFKSIKKIVNMVSKFCVDSKRDLSDYEIKDYIYKRVKEEIEESLNLKQKQKIVEIIYNSINGLGPLQPLIEDEKITEIMINSTDEIFIEKGNEIKEIENFFYSEDELLEIIQKIVSKINRVVNESNPIVNARLENGSRVNVVLPPIALKGPTVTIRKFPEKAMTINRLIEYKTLNKKVAKFLEKLVISKFNIFISGGTSSGKTSLLNALSNFIPKDERIITIEDLAELRLVNIKNLVKLETRNKNLEGSGLITIRDLIKTSLRMRPDRIIVGEVRGKEALEMLQAMNTGHDGSLSTGHANSVKDMLTRLETMVLSAEKMPLLSIKKQIASAIDIFIHLSKLRDGSRKVIEISEVDKVVNGEIQLNTIYKFIEDKNSLKNKVCGELKLINSKLKSTQKLTNSKMNLDLGEKNDF
ncbi:MAG: CpaF family protein [Bacillota bacterium]